MQRFFYGREFGHPRTLNLSTHLSRYIEAGIQNVPQKICPKVYDIGTSIKDIRQFWSILDITATTNVQLFLQYAYYFCLIFSEIPTSYLPPVLYTVGL